MSCAKNHSDPKRKSEDGHVDNSDFFIVGNALNKENFIIFVLSLDDLDMINSLNTLSKEEGQLMGVRVHLDIFSEHGSRLVIFLEIASRGLLSGG
jgi:hypothetical protein